MTTVPYVQKVQFALGYVKGPCHRITCYPTTCVISVQGAPQLIWIDRTLPDIAQDIIDDQGETPDSTESTAVNFSLNYDEHFPPLPTQSLTKDILHKLKV